MDFKVGQYLQYGVDTYGRILHTNSTQVIILGFNGQHEVMYKEDIIRGIKNSFATLSDELLEDMPDFSKEFHKNYENLQKLLNWYANRISKEEVGVGAEHIVISGQ